MLKTSLLGAAASLLAAASAWAQIGEVGRPGAGGPPPVNPTVSAPPSGVQPGADPDPYEKLNRKSYALFRFLDRRAIRPASVFYAHAVPSPVRKGLHNAIQNVHEPVIFFNDVVQAHPVAAAQTLGRFAINSTVGVAGLADPATPAGLPYHQNTFGTTLGRYGVPPGPFLFIPVLGPSDVRDIIGSGVDTLSDPLTWINYSGRWGVNAGDTVVGGLDTRANADPQLKQIDAMATDPYATLRSLYLQNRAAEITGGKVDVQALPDFGPEPPPNAAGEPGAPPAAQGPAGAASALPGQAAPTTAQPPGPPPQDSDGGGPPPASAPPPPS